MKKLKGTARIILRDAKTGEIVHDESHSNTITPALARIMADNLSGTLNYEKLLPLYSKLLGGVCLFNGTLDPTDVFLPAAGDAELTAHAGQVDYSDPADDTSRGIKGINGRVSNGYKWSWEWAQSQGNGTISDVCLTHADTGSFWREKKGNNIMAADFCPLERVDNKIINPGDFYYRYLDVDFPYIEGGENIPIAFLGDVNHVLTIKQATETTVEVNICKFTGLGAWLWNNLGEVEIEAKYTVTPSTKKYYVAFDEANLMLYFLSLDNDNGYAYDTNIKGIKVDLSTGTATSVGLINCLSTILSYSDYKKVQDGTTYEGSVMCHGVEYNNIPLQLKVVDGNIFFPLGFFKDQFLRGMVDCSIRINLANPSDQEIVKGFYDFIYDGVYHGYAQYDLGNGRVMNPKCYTWPDSNGDYVGQEILLDTLELFPDSYSFTRAFSADVPIRSPIQYMTFVRPNVNGVRGCILNKLYQATVFHLDNPVTKTATQTMTVEYTLIQQEDES